jgi:hypothetical protein
MPKKTERKGGMSADEVYATIWKVEQDHNRTRWTVTTFFLGLSFAIFGFSFRENISGNPLIPHIQRATGLVLYIFAVILFGQFQRYTNILREKLSALEEKKGLSFNLQRYATEKMYGGLRGWFSAEKLLIGFGGLYLLSVVLLWVFPI